MSLGAAPQLNASTEWPTRPRSTGRDRLCVSSSNLPPDIDTFRLQQRISQLCGPDIVAHAEYVKRDVLNGRPQEGAMSYFRNVPAGNDDVMNAIRSEQAERIGPLREAREGGVRHPKSCVAVMIGEEGESEKAILRARARGRGLHGHVRWHALSFSSDEGVVW